MSEAKFSKGEWGVFEYGSGEVTVFHGKHMNHIDVKSCEIDLNYEEKGFAHWSDSSELNREIPIEEQQANAHLIAAAPEMYEMLDAVALDLIEAGGKGNLTTAREIENILAKARGENA